MKSNRLTVTAILAALVVLSLSDSKCNVDPETQAKLGGVSLECATALLTAATPCVKECIAEPKGRTCEEVCVDVTIGQGVKECAGDFAGIKSEEARQATRAAVDFAVALYHAVRKPVPDAPPVALPDPGPASSTLDSGVGSGG